MARAVAERFDYIPEVPRRILLLITDLELGGTPGVVREISTRLHQPPSVQIEVACLGRWGPVATQIRERGIPVTALGASSATDLSAVRRLRRLISTGGFDAVLSFLVHANAAAAVAATGMRGVRLIQSIQTTQPWPRWHWAVQAVAAGAAEWVVVPSASVAAAARDRAYVPAEKVVVIPNAVDADAFERSSAPPTQVGFLGRLDPVKRVPDLVEAVAQLPGEVELAIFGEGEDRSRIESAIARLRVEHRVFLRGAVAEPQAALRQMGVLVLPSEAEGFGLVLIEAMAAGVPVVATDVAGIRDVVRDDENGLLVPPGNPTALARAISRAIHDAALREQLIENGLRIVREKYGWQPVVAAYRKLFGIEGAPHRDAEKKIF